jgi:hypothetical protein
MASRPCVLLLALIVGCGPSAKKKPDGGAGDGGLVDSTPLPHTLVAIAVTPTNPIVELDLNTSASQPFVATGSYADGVDEDLTTQVTWTVVSSAVGAMSG